MKVIIELEYNAGEWTIIKLFKMLKVSGVRYSVFRMNKNSENTPGEKATDSYYSIAFIKKMISYGTGMPEQVLNSPTRKQEVVENRQIAMYLSRKYTRKSLREIGQEFGDKTPATIKHACKTILNLCETDRKFQIKLSQIEMLLSQDISKNHKS